MGDKRTVRPRPGVRRKLDGWCWGRFTELAHRGPTSTDSVPLTWSCFRVFRAIVPKVLD